ncbi:S8 family serine peptidase [Streptomyces sp. NPDC051940]|uniref:S8 family serine peptidase n=1 Tax=Streptomyces sp. NPDC051940 TaxID=3155675 RepID=UPI00343FFCCD
MSAASPSPPKPAGRALLATALALTLFAPAAAWAGEPAEQSTAQLVTWPAAAPDTATVTLVTGDQVTVTTGADGRASVTTVPTPGGSTLFRTETGADGSTYVYPEAAAEGLSTGRLDKELFNVTRLVAEGRDDASSTTLPLIVDYAGAPAKSTLDSRAAAVHGVKRRTPLTSIGANAVAVSKKDAHAFFQDVVKGPKARISLDRKVTASLDVSVPQIGAPAVWAKGYDGTGVKVAVLDTGIDFNHPDLAGKVLDSKSFIAGQGVQDGRGHGTHVAGTIAGSGAASGGRYKGVAPGAKLLVGKVLSNSGDGTDSTVIAGIEWAVAQGADIVSMSLGAETNESSDSLSEAVDNLTETTGTLFVVAAGNAGPGRGTIGTPGIAKRALTVGAVDDRDALASFSSRGPTASGAIKPEITAPGVGIVAPRAAGTTMGTPVNASYTAADGTSMATPHVAGAAALLVQQHPDWRPELLKDALVSTAETTAGATVYEQGTGRVAVDRASAQSVFATSTADFGDLFADASVQTRQVTYTNTGTAPATLSLDLALDRGDEVPAGAVTLSDSQVTVPAGGTTAVTLAVDPSHAPTGRYNGYLRAHADGVALTTAVGFVKQAPRRTVKFKLTGRDGKAAGQTTLQIVDVASKDALVTGGALLDQGEQTLVLPEGRYAVQAILTTYDDRRFVQNLDFFAEPEIAIDADRTITLDARKARPVRADVTDEGRPVQGGVTAVNAMRERPNGVFVGVGTSVDLSDRTTEFGVIPSTTTAEHGRFDLTVDHELRDPVFTGTWQAADSTEPTAMPLLSTVQSPRFDGIRRLTAVDVGTGSAADFAAHDVAGKLVVVRANGWLAPQAALAKQYGAAAVLAVRPTAGTTLAQDAGTSPVPMLATPHAAGQALLAALADGPVTVTLRGRMNSRFTYRVPFHAAGAIPADPTVRTTTADYARLDNTYHADGVGRLAYDSTYALYPWYTGNFRTGDYHWAPGTRTDLVYAKDAQYSQRVNHSPLSATYFQEPATSYEAGRTYHRDWGRAPMHPTVPQLLPCPMCRGDEGITLSVAPYGDSDARHFGADGGKMTRTYYRDGVQYAPADLFVQREAGYRMDLRVDRGLTALDTLGSRTDTSFSFHSAPPAPGTSAPGCAEVFPGDTGCEALPLILVGYDIPVDLSNAAPSGRLFTFDVTTSRPAGYMGPAAKVRRVEVSYDDGATWQPADQLNVHDDGTAQAALRHPERVATSGYVSLRVTADDGAGDRTVQTVVRAYALT